MAGSYFPEIRPGARPWQEPMTELWRTTREFLCFLWENKFWWISPIVLMLLLLVVFIWLTERPSVIPTRYTHL